MVLVEFSETPMARMLWCRVVPGDAQACGPAYYLGRVTPASAAAGRQYRKRTKLRAAAFR